MMKKHRRQNRFRTRILVLFLTIVLLPMITLSVYLYNNIVFSTEERLSQTLSSTNSQWIAGYQARKSQMLSLAESIRINPVIQNYFSMRDDGNAQVIKRVLYSFRPMIDWLVSTNNTIDRICF